MAPARARSSVFGMRITGLGVRVVSSYSAGYVSVVPGTVPLLTIQLDVPQT